MTEAGAALLYRYAYGLASRLRIEERDREDAVQDAMLHTLRYVREGEPGWKAYGFKCLRTYLISRWTRWTQPSKRGTVSDGGFAGHRWRHYEREAGTGADVRGKGERFSNRYEAAMVLASTRPDPLRPMVAEQIWAMAKPTPELARYMAGESQAQMAAELGCSHQAVSQRINRELERLRRQARREAWA